MFGLPDNIMDGNYGWVNGFLGLLGKGLLGAGKLAYTAIAETEYKTENDEETEIKNNIEFLDSLQ